MRNVAALGVVLLIAAAATAKPVGSKFEDVLKKSAVIAVARFDGARPGQAGAAVNCVLEFTQILKGDVKPGKHVVAWRASYTPSVGPGVVEFVAFLDETMVWNYVAVPAEAGAAVAGSVLHLSGFYDYNAHFVTPSLVSLPLLETYIKKGTLVYRFRGAMWFPVRGKGNWEAGNILLEGTHDPFKQTSKIKGMPELKGLPAPKVSVSAWVERDTIHLESSRDRVLEVKGRVESLDGKTGTFNVRFYATRPDFLSQKEFEAFAADGDRGDSYHRVKVRCTGKPGEAKGRELTLRLGERGRVGSVTGWAETDTRLTGGSGGDAKQEFSGELDGGRELVFRFDRTKAPKGADVIRWTFQDVLLYDLHATDLPGEIEVRDAKTKAVLESHPFSATLEGVFHDSLGKK
jgi:hypothetical protein